MYIHSKFKFSEKLLARAFDLKKSLILWESQGHKQESLPQIGNTMESVIYNPW